MRRLSLIAALGWGSVAQIASGQAAGPPAARGMADETCEPASVPDTPPRQAPGDWAWLCRYQAANRALDHAHPPAVVFIGDSITEGWGDALFGADGLNRGIAGQTSPQILLRFWQDAVALRPLAIHIMAGTNDLAGNTGPTTPDMWKNNIRAMVAMAKAHGIGVVLGSIPPADHFAWAPAVRPAMQISALNAWLKAYAHDEGEVYADYWSALATPDGAMRAGLSGDGVHPNAAGYAVMAPIAKARVAEAVAKAASRAADKAAIEGTGTR